MSFEEKLEALSKLFWDYNIPNQLLEKIIHHEFKEIDKYDYNLIIKRMLERMQWYDLLNILGIDQLKIILSSDIIDKLRSNELKARYERIRRILFNEALSISRWDSGNIEKVKSSILSNRWYGS